MEFRNFCRCRIRFKSRVHAENGIESASQEQDDVSVLPVPFLPLFPSSAPFSLYIYRETTRSFFIPLSSSLVLHASRLDCLFLSSSLSLSEQSTPSIYLNPFVWRCLCPSHPSVCLSVSLCRIEYYPLNFNPAGIERRTTSRS